MFHRLDQLAPQSGLDGSFSCYTTLDRLPQQAFALYLLRRCAYIIGPIMRRHGWTVPMLHELSPYSSCDGKCLTCKRTTTKCSSKTTETIPLNIQLRLREASDPSQFVQMHSLIRTLLHELAHFAYRRHFVGFYKFNAVLLSELIKDAEVGELRRRVDRGDVPEGIAGMDEILCTITGDLKKSFAETIGVGKRDRYRYRV